MSSKPTDAIAWLREADGNALQHYLDQHGETLDPVAARAVLASPFADREVVARVAGRRELMSNYELRRAIVGHPKAATATALQLIPTIYWRDLVSLGLEARVAPVIRRGADRRIVDLLPSLAVGERMAIARRASSFVQRAVARDRQPRVILALLDNPRLTESVVIPLAASPATPGAVLDVVVRDRRWGPRYLVRATICRNPSCPAATALQHLSSLKKVDLRAVRRDPRVAEPVRSRAALLLGEST